MGSLCILTHAFPYLPGEQFLEMEIRYWSKMYDGKVTLIPQRAVGLPRDTPPGVRVDSTVAMNSTYARKATSLGKATLSPYWAGELAWISAHNKLSVKNALTALRTVAAVLTWRDLLRRSLTRLEKPICCYSYWFHTTAYAAALLKREGLIDHLVTRAHGTDVYEERWSREYMPLKRQFVNDFNTIFAISDEGKEYLQTRYLVPADCVEVARLGVNVTGTTTPPTNGHRVNILSVSFCVPVKRIDRIIDALVLAAQRMGDSVLFDWTHIGDGPLRSKLETQAKLAFGELRNVHFRFTGMLPNDDVLRYLGTEEIDLFLNTSESEGVPVSIMEAMSYGIPAIAPDVGGIAELVSQENGWLLPADPSTEEIAQALCNYGHLKHNRTRISAKKRIVDCYSAETNYASFVRTLSEAR